MHGTSNIYNAIGIDLLQVFLYPEEGWARNASSSYILIKMCSWWPNLCIIEEKAGTKR